MINRRSILLLPAAFALRADDRTDALDRVAPIATALTGEEPDAGWTPPKDLPNADELRVNIAAMIAQCMTNSSIEVISTGKNTAELDWYMQIRNRTLGTVIEQRRGKVSIAWTKKRLTKLEPASLFAPPHIG